MKTSTSAGLLGSGWFVQARFASLGFWLVALLWFVIAASGRCGALDPPYSNSHSTTAGQIPGLRVTVAQNTATGPFGWTYDKPAQIPGLRPLDTMITDPTLARMNEESAQRAAQQLELEQRQFQFQQQQAQIAASNEMMQIGQHPELAGKAWQETPQDYRDGMMSKYPTIAAQLPQMHNQTQSTLTGRPVGRGKSPAAAGSEPSASGTGFFITADGFLATNAHVVRGGRKFQIVTPAGIIAAKVVEVDEANDLALLKAEGSFVPLPVASSRSVHLGSTVATVGFPNIGLQGFAPKLSKGEIAALSGVQDDARYFQISLPVQPGNSGGALVDERGNVVGIVSAKLSAKAAFDSSGALPENVNYAVKSSFLLGFLESVPDVAARLKEPNTKDEKFENAVRSAEQSTALVLVY